MMKPEEYTRVCRLFNQRIAGEKFEKPEEVVRWMGALQAQDYQQSLWAIGLRMLFTQQWRISSRP